jgi:hypothetical protein
MNKSDHRNYLASEHWRTRRKKFLEKPGNGFCAMCYLPRWLSALVYDQDLHVHHRNYQNKGAELDADLQTLCPRCHEIESFGTTSLREVKRYPCMYCGAEGFDPYESTHTCEQCRTLMEYHVEAFPARVLMGNVNEGSDWKIWQRLLMDIVERVGVMEARKHLLSIEENRPDLSDSEKVKEKTAVEVASEEDLYR